ncbi:MAG: hypothetical protein LUE24_05225 [Lachnospiraceae bacterium]|nr:hypothetical protein [Lachnospiraceae bacterium]
MEHEEFHDRRAKYFSKSVISEVTQTVCCGCYEIRRGGMADTASAEDCLLFLRNLKEAINGVIDAKIKEMKEASLK